MPDMVRVACSYTPSTANLPRARCLGDVVRVGPNEVHRHILTFAFAHVHAATPSPVTVPHTRLPAFCLAPLCQSKGLPRHLQQQEPLGQGGHPVPELQRGQVQLRLPHPCRGQGAQARPEPLLFPSRYPECPASLHRQDKATVRSFRAPSQSLQEHRSLPRLPLHECRRHHHPVLWQPHPCC